MRLSRSVTPAIAAVTLLLCLPYEALPRAREPEREPSAQPFGAECRTGVEGSRAVAWCHNPYPDTDRVRLHVECARWWDVDTDTAAVDAGPARTVRLTGRCWKEIRTVWVSHQRG
ncbi:MULTISPECIES: hypothetical protein [unclassified Streptomyces]|uniref:Secreted protein n=1 Tax=Streptomyces niveiscabiei TaxID=164115 RepID=A0ABW9HSU7_9ACTN|nr:MULTISPECIES: hypothetical protein [unclassified Streptomyces]QZZ27029.1 hypothetical protein A7X85_12870 [Streptomyces sp. ST1015]